MTLVRANPIRLLLPEVTFLNPDDVALELLRSRGFKSFPETPESVLSPLFLEAASKHFPNVTTCVRACYGFCYGLDLNSTQCSCGL